MMVNALNIPHAFKIAENDDDKAREKLLSVTLDRLWIE